MLGLLSAAGGLPGVFVSGWGALDNVAFWVARFAMIVAGAAFLGYLILVATLALAGHFIRSTNELNRSPGVDEVQRS
jgi:hypothetical protein